MLVTTQLRFLQNVLLVLEMKINLFLTQRLFQRSEKIPTANKAYTLPSIHVLSESCSKQQARTFASVHIIHK